MDESISFYLLRSAVICEDWFAVAWIEPGEVDDIIKDVSPQPVPRRDHRLVQFSWLHFPLRDPRV